MQTRIADALREGTPPPQAWTLAGLFVGGAVGCVLGTLSPLHPEVPVGLLRAVAAISLALAVVAYTAGRHLGRWSIHLLLATASTLVGVLVASSVAPSGAVLSAYGYFWIGTYAAYFLTRRDALAQAALISTTFAAALLLSGVPPLMPWLVVTGSVAAAMLVLGNLVSQLSEQATTDQLTGLLNRHGMRQAAERELALAGRTGWPLSLVLVDLDNFKQVNDRGGHAAGDRLLRQFAASLQAQLRVSDVVGRHGGDEFVILLPSTTSTEAESVVLRLQPASPVAWSAGVIQWDGSEDFDQCLARADAALYRAKAADVAAPAPPGAPAQAGRSPQPRTARASRRAMR